MSSKVKKATSSFNALDLDGDGVVSREEATMDLDGDGIISQNEREQMATGIQAFSRGFSELSAKELLAVVDREAGQVDDAKKKNYEKQMRMCASPVAPRLSLHAKLCPHPPHRRKQQQAAELEKQRREKAERDEAWKRDYAAHEAKRQAERLVPQRRKELARRKAAAERQQAESTRQHALKMRAQSRERERVANDDEYYRQKVRALMADRVAGSTTHAGRQSLRRRGTCLATRHGTRH